MKTQVKNFDVQSIEIHQTPEKVFAFIADPQNLPKWTNAFKATDGATALLQTPDGEVDIQLKTYASKEEKTIDWYMTFPDGSIGTAFSRVTPNEEGASSIYSFVLMAPPVPLEALEGALKEQIATLAEELRKLKNILEK